MGWRRRFGPGSGRGTSVTSWLAQLSLTWPIGSACGAFRPWPLYRAGNAPEAVVSADTTRIPRIAWRRGKGRSGPGCWRRGRTGRWPGHGGRRYEGVILGAGFRGWKRAMAAVEKRTVSLPVAQAGYIDARVAGGAYASASELLDRNKSVIIGNLRSPYDTITNECDRFQSAYPYTHSGKPGFPAGAIRRHRGREFIPPVLLTPCWTHRADVPFLDGLCQI